MPRAPDELVQARSLTEAFFARFFESDTTVERTDATRSFLWLIAVLAAPGFLLTVYRQFMWERLARYDSVEALRQVARADTSEYLALTFVGVAIVAAVRWQGLLIDRRDALVLGALPVRPRTIVVAKLGALAGYAVLLALGTHAGPALVYGISLGGLQPTTNATGYLFGLAIAGVGLTVFVIAAAAAVQSTVLAVVGPRRFLRASVAMQMAWVAAALAVVVLLPGDSAHAFSHFDPTGTPRPEWSHWLPPLWFLGIFETVVGQAPQEFGRLAHTGWGAMALSIGVVVIAGPIACARSLRAAFEVALPLGSSHRRHVPPLPLLLALRPAVRGAIGFTAATLARVSTPRLMFAILAAAGLAAFVPVLAALSPRSGRSDVATTAVLAFPFVLQFFVLLGLRLAVRTPVELPGRWVFDQTDVSPLAGRDAAWRILLVGGVLMPAVLTGALWLWLWDPVVAIARVAAAVAGGMLALEILLWGYVGVPCTRPIVSAGFRGRTLALAVGFELFCFESAAAQAAWQDDVVPVVWQGAIFGVTAVCVHIASRRAAAVNAIVDEHLDPRLDLEVVGPLAPFPVSAANAFGRPPSDTACANPQGLSEDITDA